MSLICFFLENAVISERSYPTATTHRTTANGLAYGWFHWGLKAHRPTAPPPTGTLPHPKHRGKPGEIYPGKLLEKKC